MNKKVFVSEGVLIAGVTSIVYAIAYLYERGYNRVFSLPEYFIQIDLTSIFTSLVSFSIMMALFFILGNSVDIYRRQGRNLQFPLIRLVIATTFPLVLLMIYSFDYLEYYKWTLYTFATWIVIDFVMPIFTQRDIKGFINKVVAEEEHHQKGLSRIRTANNVTKFMNFIPGGYPVFLLFTIFILYGSYHLGTAQALTQRSYSVTDKGEVIIKRFNGGFITARLEGDVIKKEFKYRNTSSDNPLSFTIKTFDQIHIEKTDSDPKVIGY